MRFWLKLLLLVAVTVGVQKYVFKTAKIMQLEQQYTHAQQLGQPLEAIVCEAEYVLQSDIFLVVRD